jgi:hypothetical protein
LYHLSREICAGSEIIPLTDIDLLKSLSVTFRKGCLYCCIVSCLCFSLHKVINYLFIHKICHQDYQAMIAQLEHQFRLGRLSVQGLWFFCQVIFFICIYLDLISCLNTESDMCFMAANDEFIKCAGSFSREGYLQQYQWFCNT